MRPVTTLVRALCVGALVADAVGCGDGTSSSPPTGTISGTVTFAKLFAAPPVQHAAPADLTRTVRPLAAKTGGGRSALPAVVRPARGRASRPAFTPNELLVRFRPSAVGGAPGGSLALA